MKIFRALILLLVILALVSCSVNKTKADSTALRTELAKLRSFRAEGIIKISYSLLSIRQNFVVVKNDSAMRLDVIQGGIMGMQAQPILSLYLGEYLELKSSVMPQLEELDLQKMIPGSPALILNQLEYLVLEHEAEILAKRELIQNGMTFSFNQNYQLTSIIDPKERLEINFSYDRKRDLDTVIVKHKGKELLSLMVDTISYGDTEVPAM